MRLRLPCQKKIGPDSFFVFDIASDCGPAPMRSKRGEKKEDPED
jgi:hypothetical protein